MEDLPCFYVRIKVISSGMFLCTCLHTCPWVLADIFIHVRRCVLLTVSWKRGKRLSVNAEDKMAIGC